MIAEATAARQQRQLKEAMRLAEAGRRRQREATRWYGAGAAIGAMDGQLGGLVLGAGLVKRGIGAMQESIGTHRFNRIGRETTLRRIGLNPAGKRETTDERVKRRLKGK
jgi:hypothetical protein